MCSEALLADDIPIAPEEGLGINHDGKSRIWETTQSGWATSLLSSVFAYSCWHYLALALVPWNMYLRKPWLGSWILYPFASEKIWVQYPARNHQKSFCCNICKSWSDMICVCSKISKLPADSSCGWGFPRRSKGSAKEAAANSNEQERTRTDGWRCNYQTLGHYVSIYMTMQKLSTLRCDIVELRNAAERRYTIICS